MSQPILYPKVLVISINPFSKTGSNGKVLRELFVNWPKENIAQFYIYNQPPDLDACKNYFRITDKEALKAFFTGKECGKIFSSSSKVKEITIQKAPSSAKFTLINSKNPLTYLLRDFIWNTNRWKTPKFISWIDKFAPDLIFLMAGASSLTHNIALAISKQYKIPLVIYNTENYYFKQHNYFKHKSFGFLYPLYKWESDRAFRRMMEHSSYEIYGNDTLSELYSEEFSKKNSVIYQPTSLNSIPFKEASHPLVFSYIGNLGHDRHVSLQEIALSLQKISSEYFLDIYGKAPSITVLKELQKTKGIRYHGYINYDEVLKKIQESDILFHAESFEAWHVHDLKVGFSTKISDSLASGRCFVLYADKSIACSQYCIKQNCAHVITSQKNLLERLKLITKDPQMRMKYIEKAKKTAHENHNAYKNCEKLRVLFSKILTQDKKKKYFYGENGD